MKNDCLTVGELIEILSEYDKEMPVGFSYASGDYWKTQIVGKASGASEEQVKYSDYHRALELCDDDDEQYENMVVIK